MSRATLVIAAAYGAYLLYYQSHLNGIWDRYLGVAAAPPQPLAPPPPIAAAPQLPPAQNAPPPPPTG